MNPSPGYLESIKKRAMEEAVRGGSRAPTAGERASLDILVMILQELAPDVMSVFEHSNTSYTVAESDVVLGQLKQARHHKSREVMLAASVFVSEFPEAVAVFLHEHAHIFGYDGSPALTDALTRIIESVVRERRSLDGYEAKWRKARDVVRSERRTPGQTEPSRTRSRLASLGETELRELLGRVPEATLRRLLQQGDGAASQ